MNIIVVIIVIIIIRSRSSSVESTNLGRASLSKEAGRRIQTLLKTLKTFNLAQDLRNLQPSTLLKTFKTFNLAQHLQNLQPSTFNLAQNLQDLQPCSKPSKPWSES